MTDTVRSGGSPELPEIRLSAGDEESDGSERDDGRIRDGPRRDGGWDRVGELRAGGQ